MSDTDNSKDIRSRKWLITQENPDKYGVTHELIISKLNSIKSLNYWAIVDEIGGKTGTYHTHIYLYRTNDITFSRLQKLFNHANILVARGTTIENRNYLRKEGKYAGTDKEETNLPSTFEEYGEVPDEQQGKRNDLTLLYGLIADGYTDSQLLMFNPELAKHIDKFERIRQSINENIYSETFRQLEVTYISGPTRTGKTRSVMDSYGYKNVYRVTNYQHPFDSYCGQDVILFDEFRSSLKFSDMLVYLDGYPIKLPCRYYDRQACYTKVYIVSNIDIHEQYINVQSESPASWQAFLSRITNVRIYTPFGEFSDCHDWEQLRLQL